MQYIANWQILNVSHKSRLCLAFRHFGAFFGANTNMVFQIATAEKPIASIFLYVVSVATE